MKTNSAPHEGSRVETDSLGQIEVPDSALYGAQTARAIANYPISGRKAHPELIRAYLRLKRACSETNTELGVLPASASQLIVRAIDDLLARSIAEWQELFPVDPYQAGAGTSQNMNLNEVIANVANLAAGQSLGSGKPIHPNDHVNRSQSTNDSFPTAMRLALLDASASLSQELALASKSLAQKASQWRDILKSARTHLQDAVPITLGQEFGAYARTLESCGRYLETSREELRILGIGGSAAGTGVTVPKGYPDRVCEKLSALIGEKVRSAPDLCEAMQSQRQVMHYSSTLRLLALELTRICNDLRLLASGPMTGLGEILLPAVQPGSSIMPGKVNPSILEMANQTWFSVLGFDQTVAFTMQAGQLDLNVMMPMMAYSLLEATRVSTNALRVLRLRCFDGLEPNHERLQEYFEKTPQVATALSPALGYERTADLVKESLRTGKSVVALARQKGLLTEEQLNSLLDRHALTGT